MGEDLRTRPGVPSIASALTHWPELSPCKGGRKCLAQEAEEVKFGEHTCISATQRLCLSLMWTVFAFMPSQIGLFERSRAEVHADLVETQPCGRPAQRGPFSDLPLSWNHLEVL